MKNNVSKNTTNIAAIMHGATLLKYFFPFANFIIPLLLWSIHKDIPFLNQNGKQSLNFQLSVLVYAFAIGLISIPFVTLFASDFIELIDVLNSSTYQYMQFSKNMLGYFILLFVFTMAFIGLFIFELYYVITATIKASNGVFFNYPLCIPFISTSPKTTTNQPL